MVSIRPIWKTSVRLLDCIRRLSQGIYWPVEVRIFLVASVNSRIAVMVHSEQTLPFLYPSLIWFL
jgi:hypothetical protein